MDDRYPPIVTVFHTRGHEVATATLDAPLGRMACRAQETHIDRPAVELRGLEPLTSAMRMQRSPS
jgi:hypothetical protein